MSIVLKVNKLKKYYYSRPGLFSRQAFETRAVDDINFSLNSGEVLGIVGESGCGKTTLAKLLTGIISPTSGEIFVNNKNIRVLDKQELKKLRSKIQIVFQDPYASLDPRFKVFDIILEPLIIHGLFDKATIKKKLTALLEDVGLSIEYLARYPHQLSGGERQRVSIARALAIEPEILILDEPVSSLDVSVQAKILNLLSCIKKQRDITYIFISHNLAVVTYLSDKIMVMQQGKIVEFNDKEEVLRYPKNSYTKYLFDAVPKIA